MSTTIRTDAAPSTAGRITVALTERVARELEMLQGSTGLSKTDAVNRSISLYKFVEDQRGDGLKLALFDPETKEVRLVEIL